MFFSSGEKKSRLIEENDILIFFSSGEKKSRLIEENDTLISAGLGNLVVTCVFC